MNQNINVDLIPKFAYGNLYFSQYDVGREAIINLVNGSTKYEIPSGATVTLVATKPSGLGFTQNCTFEGNQITVVCTAEMTDEAGRFPCELRIVQGSTILGTANFTFNVERSPHPEGTTDGTAESVVSEITLALQDALTDLQTESATQQDAIQAKGDEVIASIPSDYTELSNEVDDLRSALETGEVVHSFNGGDVDVTLPFDPVINSNIIKIYHGAITYRAATSFAVQYKETENGATVDILRQTGNQAEMESLYYVPSNAKYLRIVLHSTDPTTASITTYVRDAYYGYEPFFEWTPTSGYTDAESYYFLVDLIAGEKYHFRFFCEGFDSSNNSHAVVQSCNLYTLAQHEYIEDIFRYTTATESRSVWTVEGKYIDVEYIPTQNANCIRVYLNKFTSFAKFAMLSKEINSDMKLLFNNVTQGQVKYIVDGGIPKPFTRIGTFGSNIGGLQALAVIGNKIVTASLGNGGTYAVWDSINNPLHHTDITSSNVSHVINMDVMKSGNLIVANGESDSVRPVYELNPETLAIVNTFNVPATSPDDANAVLYFADELISGNLVTIYATKTSEGNKKFWVYEFDVSNDSTVLKTTFNVNVRYFQDGCMLGDFAYIFGNWGDVGGASSGNVLIILDRTKWTMVKTIDFKNFLEVEGCAFVKSNTNTARLIFGENGGNWLYEVNL